MKAASPAIRRWSAAEESSFFTGRGLIATGVIIILGDYILQGFGIPEPAWVEKVLLMLFGGILTAYNTRPEGRQQTVTLTAEGNPPPPVVAPVDVQPPTGAPSGAGETEQP